MKVKVGAYTFTVVFGVTEEGKDGECDLESQVIHVDSTLGNDRRREVLLHELLHAAWYQTALKRIFEDEDEELIIWSLACQLLEFFRQPNLVHYLRHATAPYRPVAYFQGDDE